MARLTLALAFALLTQLACAQDAAPAAAQPAERAVAGTVSLVEGDVRFLDPNQQARRPAPGDAIYEGDSIVTGRDGEVHLDMQDGGYIGVRPGTNMRIQEFKAEGGSDDGFLIGLLEGSFRAVSGWITRSGSRRADIQTATATIGVRGTDYEPLVIPEGSSAGEPGTYNRVNIGETELRTKDGSVIVKPNQAGFVPHRGGLKPRVLDRVPGFFKPTKNEKRFEGLHERIHKNIKQKRQLRVKQVQERRQQQRMKPAPAQKSVMEPRREQQRQRELAAKQQRLQEAQKREHQREAQKAALKAQKQVEERRKAQQEHAKAAKKGEHEERKKRWFEKRD